MNVLSYGELHRKGDEYHSNYIPRSNDNEGTLKSRRYLKLQQKRGFKTAEKKGFRTLPHPESHKTPGKYTNGRQEPKL